ncbi:hypothetical protein LR48_Vigan349s000300 [Vigna angularis]|uniref:Uncharacterized protein n=1 Tax=Phaseolus angularis TaxID=3914 RepID=A0A0L9TA62_PHAAN|nr:hypothetical protein LR48_Vigan349s000300 [Vigna angularis]
MHEERTSERKERTYRFSFHEPNVLLESYAERPSTASEILIGGVSTRLPPSPIARSHAGSTFSTKPCWTDVHSEPDTYFPLRRTHVYSDCRCRTSTPRGTRVIHYTGRTFPLCSDSVRRATAGVRQWVRQTLLPPCALLRWRALLPPRGRTFSEA